jgi:hypothetical protein
LLTNTKVAIPAAKFAFVPRGIQLEIELILFVSFYAKIQESTVTIIVVLVNVFGGDNAANYANVNEPFSTAPDFHNCVSFFGLEIRSFVKITHIEHFIVASEGLSHLLLKTLH